MSTGLAFVHFSKNNIQVVDMLVVHYSDVNEIGQNGSTGDLCFIGLS